MHTPLVFVRSAAREHLKNPEEEANVVRFNPNETKEHFLKKAEICYELMRQGKHFITRAKLNYDLRGIKRPDIFVLDDFEVIQIVQSTEQHQNFTFAELYYRAMGLKLKVVRI